MFRWSAEYDEYLMRTRHLPAKEIAAHLGISPHAVYQRRHKLGITFHKSLDAKPMPNGKSIKWPPTIKMIKDFVMSRDNYACHYCGEIATEIDHKKPRVRGGLNIASNLVASCRKCNNLKGSACYECPQLKEMLNV